MVRHDGGNGGLDTRHSDEDADVLAPRVLDEAHDGQADEGDEDEANEDGATRLVFVGVPGGAVHEEAGEGVGGRAHALGHGDAEFELGVEDDGEEEGEAVGDGGGEEEKEGEGVDVPFLGLLGQFCGLNEGAVKDEGLLWQALRTSPMRTVLVGRRRGRG